MKRLLCTLAAATALLGLTPHNPVITASDAAAPVTIKAGEDFLIALQSNRTTGYAWTAKVADGKIAAYEGNAYQNPDAARPGAAGQQIFIFHANRSGSTTIDFGYARPFEPNAAPSKTLTFSITVQ